MKPWNQARSTEYRITNNNEIVRFVFEEMCRQRIHECDFIHKFFDKRCFGDIDFDNDTVIFGRKTKLTPHPIWVDQDHNRH